MGITRDNLHLSEPIRDAEAAGYSIRRSKLQTGNLDPAVCELVEAATAPNTRRAYESDLAHFLAWGGAIPAAPEFVARYLAHHARTLTVATLARRLVAIRRAHALEDLPDPTASHLIRQTLRGLRRLYGRPQRRVAALTAEHLAATSAAAAGIPIWKIKAQTGHLSDAVLSRYIRISDPFAGNATASMVSSSA